MLGVANPFFADVVRGAEMEAEQVGGVVVVCNSGDDAAREHRHLDILEEQWVQGVLITPVHDGSRLEQLIARGTPVVLVGRGSGRLHRCSVAVDPVLGGRLAGDPYDVERAMRAHLLAARERHLPFFEGP